MKLSKWSCVFLTGFFLLFLSSGKVAAETNCSLPVLLVSDGSAYTSIQEAYNTASLSYAEFTLRLAGQTFNEDLTLDGGAVTLDGGYDCSLADEAKAATPSSILGSITILSGSLVATANTDSPRVISAPQCAFDNDNDGFTSIGSCEGSADDCDDNNPAVYPGAPEVCDGLDNNCNGQVDDGLTPIDADGDGYDAIGSCGTNNDCDDGDFNINPGAVDYLGDNIDQDCDGRDLTYAPAFPVPYARYNEYDCLGCHYGANIINNVYHQSVAAPDSSCAGCHASQVNNVLPGHYGETVQTADDYMNMAAGQVIICVSCHDYHNPATGYSIIGAAEVWPRVQPSWNGSAYVGVTCDTCHLDRAAKHNTENSHNNRLIDALCANCHTSDTTVIGQPGAGELTSQADVDILHKSSCAICHDYANYNSTSANPLDPAVVAQAVAMGTAGTPIECLTCHEANFDVIHAFIENHNNLVRVGATSCGNCHSDPPPLINPDDPKAHSTCSNCHDADYNTISLAAGKTFAAGGNCTTCHGADFTGAHPDTVDHTALVNVGLTSCGDCHSGQPPLVDPVDPKVHNACLSCHDSNGNLVSLAIGQTFAEPGDCSSCHTQSFETVHPADVDHSGIVTTTGTACGSCHLSTLLVDPADPTVHNGCSSCHDVDGGLISLAENVSAPGNCNDCHGADFTLIHPDTIDHTAIVTVGETSCGSCHSDQPPLVSATDPKVHDACASCHDSDGNLVGRAIGESFNPGGTCATCHTETFEAVHSGGDLITGHSDIVTTTGTECGSCHSNPPPLVALNDPKVHDQCGSCHAGDGALIGLAVGAAAPGNCNTCHGADFTVIHPDDIDHSAIVKSGTTSCSSCHFDPTTLVDVDPINANDPKLHDDCTSCHDSNGGLVSLAIGQSFDPPGGDCTTCHGADFTLVHPANVDHSLAIQLSNDCASCHSAPPPVVDPLDATNHDYCTSCHSSDGILVNDAAGNTAPNECVTCHGNDIQTLHPNVPSTAHDASPGSDAVLVFKAGEHDSSMSGDGTVFMACDTCHSTSLGKVHDNNCALCHSGSPSPYDSLGGSWDKTCDSCHKTYHAEVSDKHNQVTDYQNESNCLECHISWSTFVPTPSVCANCHATYSASDTVAPVTTSDVQPTYIVPALINFTVTDNGGKVGLGITYARLNGGPLSIGDSLLVEAVGNYELEFWTVDQAGNEELPHNVKLFTIGGDTEPPVTTADALSNYEVPANITLTATDNNQAGIITTYYSLNGGTIMEGTSVNVPELDGTFSYSLEYWSVDPSGNEELPHKTVDFTIHGGTGTLRLVWFESDTSGSPCAEDPDAEATWTIRSGGQNGSIVAEGLGACPGWSGVDDVTVDVSLTSYFISIDWYDSGQGFYENTTYPAVDVYPHGDLERLQY